MTRSLWNEPLEGITWNEVSRFLALDRPPAERPHAGARLEYHADLCGDLGEVATAFANTRGGVVILGVATEDGLPVAVQPLDDDGDLERELAEEVTRSVVPRPAFSVRVLPPPAPRIALVRIEEGDWPPYLRAADNRVAIRVERRSVPAGLTDLEALFARRRQREARRERAAPAGDLHVLDLLRGAGVARSPTFLRVWVRPVRALGLELGQALEDRVKRLLTWAFPEEKSLSARRHDHFELDGRDATIDFHRRWRFHDDGSLGFASQVAQPAGARVVFLHDVAVDVLRALRGARAVLADLGVTGRVALEFTLALDGAPVAAGSSDGRFTLDGVPAVGALAARSETSYCLTMDLDDLDRPAAFLADFLAAHLSAQRGVEVDHDLLTPALEHLAMAAPSAEAASPAAP
jgi:hypothetical protein